MTPKEKAFDLFDKYMQPIDGLHKYPMCFDTAKQCALIAVDEVMKAPFENSYLELVPDDAPDSDWYWDKFREYWEQVKNEINNL